MGDALTGIASVIGAIGTIVTVYLAYRIAILQKVGDGKLTSLEQTNDALRERVEGLLEEAEPPK